MNKSELISAMAAESQMSKADAKKALPEKAAQWAVRVADAICRELDAPEE